MAARKKKAKVRDEALANIDDGCDFRSAVLTNGGLLVR